MKKIILLVILAVSILTFAGCKAKDISSKTSGSTTSTAVNASQSSKTDEPNTLPELNQQEKAQISENLKPAVESIDSALKTLEEVNDIDLSSIDE